MQITLTGVADVLGVDDSKWKISFEVSAEVGGFVKVEVMPCVA